MTLQHNLNPPFPDLDLVFVEGGEFLMGNDSSKYESDKPAHRVKVSSFYLGKYQVTQRLWQAVMGGNPSTFKSDLRPVETISWEDAKKFIAALNENKEINEYLWQLDPPGGEFRLPTEAEWEFAGRGGIYSQGYAYCGSDKLKQVGWYSENSNGETHDFGLMLANELGLLDMSGNVLEWCEDWFEKTFYEKCIKQGMVENPLSNIKGDYRVIRGGGYLRSDDLCHPTFRSWTTQGLRADSSGFRLALSFQSV